MVNALLLFNRLYLAPVKVKVKRRMERFGDWKEIEL